MAVANNHLATSAAHRLLKLTPTLMPGMWPYLQAKCIMHPESVFHFNQDTAQPAASGEQPVSCACGTWPRRHWSQHRQDCRHESRHMTHLSSGVSWARSSENAIMSDFARPWEPCSSQGSASCYLGWVAWAKPRCHARVPLNLAPCSAPCSAPARPRPIPRRCCHDRWWMAASCRN